MTRKLAEQGIEANFIDGLRVTDKETIRVVDEVLNGEVNEEVASFVSSTIAASGGFRERAFVLYKASQRTRPRVCGKDRISPFGTDSQGIGRGPHAHPFIHCIRCRRAMLRVNADTVAAQIAIALKARRLVYLSDVPVSSRTPKIPPPCSPASRASGRTSQGAKVIAKACFPR